MISDELFQKLIELNLIPSFRKPTFEEIWALLPATINNDKCQLFIQKGGYTRMFYKDNNYRNKFVKILTHDDNNGKSLSDLAAEMLIELKNRGMME